MKQATELKVVENKVINENPEFVKDVDLLLTLVEDVDNVIQRVKEKQIELGLNDSMMVAILTSRAKSIKKSNDPDTIKRIKKFFPAPALMERKQRSDKKQSSDSSDDTPTIQTGAVIDEDSPSGDEPTGKTIIQHKFDPANVNVNHLITCLRKGIVLVFDELKETGELIAFREA